MAGLVTAEDLRDVAEDLHAADDGLFEEAVFEEIVAAEADVVFDAAGANVNCAIGRFFGGGEAGVGHEERAESVPVALACGAGDYVVERGQNAVDGFNIVGLCSGDTCKWIGRGLLRSGMLLSSGFLGIGLSGGCWIRNGERCGKGKQREFHSKFSRAILLR